jgi:antitoxin component YwqK of YwqJK toxin-antitoxin module
MLENNVDFCGVVRTYYDDAKTKLYEEYFKMNGKKEGIYKSYWNNGQLWEEVNYIDGKMNGIYKRYHYNGQLWEEVNYIDGLRQWIETMNL